jgi:hypothetical protein
MRATWAGRSHFEYSGSVETGTDIIYGQGWKVRVDAQEYAALRRHFLNRIVPVGTSRTDPPEDSLGAWLQSNVTRTGIASYVAPILLLEGYAVRVGKSDIQIIR